VSELVPEAQRFSSMEPIGWWRLVDDITEYNRENEKLGLRAVVNTGPGFAYFELQNNPAILSGGLLTDNNWYAKERCPLEFFVMRGRFDTTGQWVTKFLKAFVVGIPSPFFWVPCDEPEAYQHRIPGTFSMVITENDPPNPDAAPDTNGA
jgi:hypothetical protein